MTSPRGFTIQALVSASERPAVAKAAELLSSSLTRVGDRPWTVDCAFLPSFDAPLRVSEPSLVVTSLLPEVDRFEEPWPVAEARLRARFQALCEDDLRTVFVCTVFRHVGRDIPDEQAARRRIRIRRLNLLAAELSREIGPLVADIDRDLADAGALALDTDYRLLGPYASAAAGKSMTMALLLVGLDAFVPFEIQEAARELVKAYQPPRGAPVAPAPLTPGGHVGVIRSKQRIQVVEYADAVADHTFVAAHIRRLLSGKIGFADATQTLQESVARRGLRRSVARLTAGLWKAVGDARPARR